MEAIRFQAPVETGGKLAVSARGADVNIASLGTLNVDAPFANRVVDAPLAQSLAAGLGVNGTGPAKVVAFYTPP